MDVLTAGNPVAHRVRVHYIDTSTKILEGMPVCYNYDTDTNWWGGSVSDAGVVTAATTLAESNQNPAKYIEVELPSASNLHAFAGVVAKGGWCGKTTSSTSGVGQILDIYVPNGAIVPVLCDVDTTTGVTILAITSGEEELGFLAANSRPVAIAMETEDALGTAADITLAKLDPGLFSFNYGTSDSAYAVTPGTYPVNYQYIELTSTAPTVGFIQDNRMLYNVAMASGQLGIANNYLHFTGSNAAVGATYIRSAVNLINLDDCTINSDLCSISACYASVGGGGTVTLCEHTSAFWADMGLGTTPGGGYEAIRITNNATGVLDALISAKYGSCNNIFSFDYIDAGMGYRPIIKMTVGHTNDTDDYAMKVNLAGSTYYIPLYSTYDA